MRAAYHNSGPVLEFFPMQRPTKSDIDAGLYPRWDENTEFEKSVLRHFGFPEDYHPTEEEAYQLMTAVLEGDD